MLCEFGLAARTLFLVGSSPIKFLSHSDMPVRLPELTGVAKSDGIKFCDFHWTRTV